MAETTTAPGAYVSLELEDVQREMPNAGRGGWQDELDRRRERMAEHAREVRGRAERICPPGRVIDRAHLVSWIGQAWVTHYPVQLARRFVARAWIADGFTIDALARAWSDTPERIRAIAGAPLWWDPDPELVADVHPAYRSVLVGER